MPTMVCFSHIFFWLVVASPVSSGGFSSPSVKPKRIRFPFGRELFNRPHKQGALKSFVNAQTNSLEQDGQEGHKSRHDDDDDLFRRSGMAVALFSTYFTVMGAKCALPSVLPLLLSKSVGLSFEGFDSKPQALMAQQLTLSTMAVALGKLILGPIIDRYGGSLSLLVCLSCLFGLLCLIATAHHFTTFAIAWIFVDFIFSSCWAGCVNAVHQSFPESEWAPRIAMIAAAARTGNASAFFVFGKFLGWSQSWRSVFWVSAALQILPISLLAYFGNIHNTSRPTITENEGIGNNGSEKKKLISPPSKPSLATSLSTLAREAKTLEFWLHMVNRSALMVFGSFLLFVPTLMSKIYGLSNAQAAQVGSIFAVGCLLSVTCGSQLYAQSSRRRKIIYSIGLMGMATLCAGLQWGHMQQVIQLSANLATALMFLWGFSFAIPFYIPASLFALARGGKESSATIVDVFDFGGFSLLALFNGYVASISHTNLAAWIPTFQILTACGASSLVSLALATYLE